MFEVCCCVSSSTGDNMPNLFDFSMKCNYISKRFSKDGYMYAHVYMFYLCMQHIFILVFVYSFSFSTNARRAWRV